jgi:hypothetical protein
MAKNVINAGQKVRFDPFEECCGFGIEYVREEVVGTVVKVYPEHKWFAVVYGDPKQRTSFNFADIGKSVFIVG